MASRDKDGVILTLIDGARDGFIEISPGHFVTVRKEKKMILVTLTNWLKKLLRKN